jgi:hypothetical protein
MLAQVKLESFGIAPLVHSSWVKINGNFITWHGLPPDAM